MSRWGFRQRLRASRYASTDTLDVIVLSLFTFGFGIFVGWLIWGLS